ncbi:unnamed protein product [Protopolystoma xenopodis]|uniref:Uncharacterized protein n=1 Tax=Protopolystoma xenopodis TaxID=117903 RepID=A0A448WSV3_9PLAT|nr:unnamed protein product [Protopolystoma xenopodis]
MPCPAWLHGPRLRVSGTVIVGACGGWPVSLISAQNSFQKPIPNSVLNPGFGPGCNGNSASGFLLFTRLVEAHVSPWRKGQLDSSRLIQP